MDQRENEMTIFHDAKERQPDDGRPVWVFVPEIAKYDAGRNRTPGYCIGQYDARDGTWSVSAGVTADVARWTELPRLDPAEEKELMR